MSDQSASSNPNTGEDRETDKVSEESLADDFIVQGPREEEGHVESEHVDTATAKISHTSVTVEDDAIPTISKKDIMGSTAAKSCDGLYRNADILQAGEELCNKYGHLNFPGKELADLIEKNLSLEEESSPSCTGLFLMSDSGHKEDGEHLIKLSKCDRCASKGKNPNVKWVSRDNTV